MVAEIPRKGKKNMWQLPKLSPSEILIYLRKSRTDDPILTVQEVLSKHEQMLDEWVERNLPHGSGLVPEENRYREVVSGETIESRPYVQQLLRQIESPKYKAVLIVEPQRLSRGDLEDIGRLVKLFRYTNTIVITLQYTYDLQDERDRDLFERELKRGNEFLEYQKRIMGNGRLLSVSNGNFVGNKAPFGYRRIQVKDGRRSYWTLEPVPEEAKIVKMIFERYANGESAHQIARTLNEMAIPTVTGVQWGAASIKPIVANVHYIGMVRWNNRKSVKIVEDGEIITTRPRNPDDCLIYPGKHPAIIEQDLWDRVQAVRGTHPPVKDRTRYANPFAGLIYCKNCGKPLSRRQYMKDGKEKSQPRLLCDGQVQCGTASCSVAEMVQEMRQILNNAIRDFDLKIAECSNDSVLVQQELVSQLEHRLDELNKRELAQWDKYTQEGMPRHIFEALNAKVLQEKEAVQQALQNAKETIPEPVDYARKRATFVAALESLEDSSASVREQNQLLKQCISRISYNRVRPERTNNRWGPYTPITLEVDLKI